MRTASLILIVPEDRGSSMAVKYTCPDCKSVLRPTNPVAPGKKIKCPECEAIFVPVPATKAEKPAPKKESKAAPKAASSDEDEDEGGIYGVAQESTEKTEEQKKGLHFGSLRDKYAKSKRGPAMAMCVQPANTMMLMGAILCILMVVFCIWAIFPMVFTEKALPSDRMKEQIIYLVCGICGFVYGGLVCNGASKMQALESYSWAMVGSVMAIPLLLVGMWGIVTLRNEEVIAGFEEKPVADHR